MRTHACKLARHHLDSSYSETQRFDRSGKQSPAAGGERGGRDSGAQACARGGRARCVRWTAACDSTSHRTRTCRRSWVRRKPVDASRAFCRCVHASATHASATGDVSARVRASACQKRRTSAPNRADVGGPHQRGVLYRADDRTSAPPPRWHGVVHAAWLLALHRIAVL